MNQPMLTKCPLTVVMDPGFEADPKARVLLLNVAGDCERPDVYAHVAASVYAALLLENPAERLATLKKLFSLALLAALGPRTPQEVASGEAMGAAFASGVWPDTICPEVVSWDEFTNRVRGASTPTDSPGADKTP